MPVRGTDTETAAIVKGDARMAEVLRRALWSSLRRPAAALVVPRGSRRWRVAAYELQELVAELSTRGVRYGAARELLEHRIAHVVLTQMEEAGEACDDRTHEAVRRSRPVRAAVDAIWPKVDPVRLVFGLLSSADALAEAAGGVLSAAEQEAILWSPAPRGPGSARWSAADAVLIDEARDLITRTPSLAHVVVDEAQDLSPMECRALGRRCSTGAATVLGDLAQGTTPWAASSWASLLSNLGKPDTYVRELSVGYRVPRQILDYASCLLAVIAPELRPASSLRADPGALDVVRVPAAALGPEVVAACARACARPGSVAVIAADPQVPRPGRRAGGGRDGARHARLGCPADAGAGHPGQGPGVRSRHRGRARPDRPGRGPGPAAAVRGAHPGRVAADRPARRAAAGPAACRTTASAAAFVRFNASFVNQCRGPVRLHG